MVYLEKQKRGRRIHYYLAKTVRLPNNKFKKIRQPIASSSREFTPKEEKQLIKENKENFTKLLYKTSPENLTDFKHEIFWDNTILYTKEDIKKIEHIKKIYASWKKNTNLDLKFKIEEQFLIEHVYDTNRAEGNTFTLKETELLLTKGIIDKTHKKREVFEIENTVKAFEYIQEYTSNLDMKFIQKVHELITKNALLDPNNEGRIRKKGEDVRMLGNPYICPSGGLSTKKLLKETLYIFHQEYEKKPHDSIVRFYSAFVAIHPFVDGNGRTSRMLLNWLLIREGLPPINFKSQEHEKHCILLNNFAFGKDKLGLSDYIFDRIVERRNEIVHKKY
ncbi:MAG: Fic family protein [Candidatus Woesearchaeota archaeon]